MAFIVHGASFHGQADLGADLSTMASQPSSKNSLICTGCNNFEAGSHDDLKEHYRTEWHRHNLKRKVAGLAPIDKGVFEERVAAYVSEKDQTRGKKKEHLSQKARDKQEKKEQEKKERLAAGLPERAEQQPEVELPDFNAMTEEEFMDWKVAHSEKLELSDSLFDRHSEENVSEALEYMAKQFGFFVPFLDDCLDLEGLVHYLGQKVAIGNCCLWCARSFGSIEAVRQHMCDKGHCKICIEGSEEEYQDFYSRDLETKTWQQLLEEDSDSDSEWSTDEEDELDGEDKAEAERAQGAQSSALVVATQGKLAEAARMSKKHAKTVSELVIGGVSGGAASRVLGHRAFRNYYRQNLRPERIGMSWQRGQRNEKIIRLLTDSYKANGIMTLYKGSSRVAKANRQVEKQEKQRDHKWWMKVGIKANKFHQVRREDYHA